MPQGFLKSKKAGILRSCKYLPHKVVCFVIAGILALVACGQGFVRLGYAVLSSDAGSSQPAANALLQASNPEGVLISETSIEAVPPVQSGLLFIDESRTKTGLILVNSLERTANVTLFLKDETGVERSHRVIALSPHHQLSEFAFEIFGADAANLKGTVAFQSDAPIVVAGLRQNLNTQGEGVYSAVPVVSSGMDESTPLIIPLVRSGDPYSTQVVLLNGSDQRSHGRVRLTGNSSTEIAFDIPANGLQTMDIAASFAAGYAEVFPDEGSPKPGAIAFLQLKSALGLVSETVVPRVPLTVASRVAVEEMSGIQTQLNLANPNADSIDITFTLIDRSGGVISSLTRNMPPKSYSSESADELFPGISFGFLGQIQMEAPEGFAAIALRSTMNKRNDTVLAALPALDMAPQSLPYVVFPDIVIGGGFSTRLMLANGDTEHRASGQIAFFQPDGTPLNPLLPDGAGSTPRYQLIAAGSRQFFPGNTASVSSVSLRDPISNEATSEITINEGGFVQPSVLVVDSTGMARDDFKVTVVPTNKEIVSVDPTGTIVGLHAGFSTVVIEAGGKIQSATATVVNVESSVAGYAVSGVAVDSARNLYLASPENQTILLTEDVRQTPGVWAGMFQSSGFKDDVRLASQFHNPSYLALQTNGTVYVSDSSNHVIRQIRPGPNGRVTTLPNALFNNPQGVALDDRGFLWVADSSDHAIRRINLVTGEVTTVAGKPGVSGLVDGQGAEALFNSPTGIAFEPESLAEQLTRERTGTPRAVQMIVADTGNSVIRRVRENGDVSTVSDSSSPSLLQSRARIERRATLSPKRFNRPVGVSVDAAGTIYVVTGGDVRAVLQTNSIVRTAQAGTLGQAKGIATTQDGRIVVSDNMAGPREIQYGRPRVTSVTPVRISSLGGAYVTIRGSNFSPETIVILAGTVIRDAAVSDTETITFNAPQLESGRTTLTIQNRGGIAQRDFVVDAIPLQDLAPGSITTLVGGSTFVGDGGPATDAPVALPEQAAIDAVGNIYFTDTANQKIRRVDHATGVITTVAGSGDVGGSGDGGPAIAAAFSFPAGIAIDRSGNVFISDTGNSRIRKIDAATGTVTTIAGRSAGFSGDGGPALFANLNAPRGLAFDSSGNLYIADSTNHRVRKITPGGVMTTVAGNGIADFSGDGGPATDAALNGPRAIAVDLNGNLWIADTFNNRVRQVDTSGKIRTINAGDLQSPEGIAATVAGDVLVSDSGGNRILRVDSLGNVSVVAGTGTAAFSGDGGSPTGASLAQPFGLAVDGAGLIVVADHDNNRIRKIAEGGTRTLTPFGVKFGTLTIMTVAGNGQQSYLGDDGPATAAKLIAPTAVVSDPGGNLFVADAGNGRVRRVDHGSGIITTIAGTGTGRLDGDGGLAINASLHLPQGLALDAAGLLYIADTNSHRVRKIDLNGGISTFAGTGVIGYSGDNQSATSASLSFPVGLAFDQQGNLYIADTGNHRIRKVAAETGLITTVAGNGLAGFSNDGQLATAASLDSPRSVVVDAAGNLYIADSGNDRIRRVDARTRVIETIAGTGESGFSGDGGPAVLAALNRPLSVATDPTGGLLILDKSNQRLRQLQFSTGLIKTVAGTGTPGFSGDNGPADKAMIWSPSWVAVDVAGTILIADTGRIRGVKFSSQ
jgi:sugar lactone lactonase YvrE